LRLDFAGEHQEADDWEKRLKKVEKFIIVVIVMFIIISFIFVIILIIINPISSSS